MAAAKSYRGRAPLTIVKDAEGRHVYVYLHRPVPAGVPQEEIDRLVRDGFLEEAPAKGAAPADDKTE